MKRKSCRSANHLMIPRFIFNEEFNTLSADAKILYILCSSNSVFMRIRDINGEGFIFCENEEAGRVLEISVVKVRKVFAELETFGLIKIRIFPNECQRIYILDCKPSYPAGYDGA